ncbi:hypothetical protein [Vibrio parahaemolyticus]|jgi:predicted RNase H-like nuclease (RuvC/YqgF family)|uniref:hypothetical protein n=1 Tax=Vibrio parahaemolyticus TaxID=670 RepID=UPI00039C2BCC|nr:hypothetical protein CGJ09_00790 [Vibrio parahaemolyticus]
MSSKEWEAEARKRKQAKAEQLEIKKLKKELRHKEKALTETATLLVLRKKLRAFTGKNLRMTNLSRRKTAPDCSRCEAKRLPIRAGLE